jgi:tRNA(Ile)-lysidine synthase
VAAWAEQAADARRLLLMAWHRRWVRQQAPGAVALGAHDVKRLADEVPRAWRRSGVGQWPHVGLSLYRGVLQAHAASAGRVVASTQEGCAAGAVGRAWALGVTGAGLWPLPAWGGMLEVTEATLSSGMAPTDEEVTQPLQALQSISLDTLRSLEVRPRSGGERYQMGPGRPPRSLRKQFQGAGVPPWARDVPLFWAGEQLVFVPGLGIDARAGGAVEADTGPGATRSGPHFTLRWLPMAV